LTLADDIKIEVLSIKPVPRDERTIFTNGKTIHSSCTLRGQIQFAYETIDFRVDSLPSWVTSQGFDITAKAESDTALTAEQFRQLLRAVLAEKFQLKVHRVVEEVPVYALVIDKKPLMTKSGPNAVRSEKRLDGMLQGTHYDMASLTRRLRQELDHQVIDMTGLTGFYDLTLEWAPDQSPASVAPSIFTAVKTQLGLKLELRKKHPVEFLIIDHAAQPEVN